MSKDFDLFAWLDTGTTATRDVVIYNDHEAYQEAKAVNEELDNVEQDDMTLGAGARRAQLREQLVALSDRMEASKMVWQVRALSDSEIQASQAAHPEPKLPIEPTGIMNDKLREKYETRMHAYREAKIAIEVARRLWVIECATTTITTEAGSREGITTAELEKLLQRPHGSKWITLVYNAVLAATSQEVTPDFPK